MSAVICILPSKTHTDEPLQFAYSQDVIITHWGRARPGESRGRDGASQRDKRYEKIYQNIQTGEGKNLQNIFNLEELSVSVLSLGESSDLQQVQSKTKVVEESSCV